MATRTQYSSGGTLSRWDEVDFIAVVRSDDDEIVILNSDGSETRLFSSVGDFTMGAGGLSGTVTSMARTSDDGSILYEAVHGVSLSASDLLSAGSSLFDVVLDMAVTLTSASWPDGLTPIEPFGFQGLDPWSQTGFSSSDMVSAVNGQSVVSFLDGLDDYALAAATGTYGLVADIGSTALQAMLEPTLSVAGSEKSTVESSTSAVSDSNAADKPMITIAGTSGADLIAGTSGNDVIAAGKGNDLITLGGGDDVIVFNLGDGVDTIADFGISGTDSIVLSGFAGITSFDQLLSSDRLVTVDGHAELRLGDNDAIVLQNVVSHTLLSASQFQFHI
ncbi:MAG: hypothetical protein AB7F78_02980 [Hyphomicrobiaceae bacterium]